MNNLTIELDSYDMAEAFKQARNQVYHELYTWHFMINFVTVQLKSSAEYTEQPEEEIVKTEYVYSFQYFKL